MLVDGEVVGDDPVGMAPWVDWVASMHHRVINFTQYVIGRSETPTLVFAAGCGAWCPTTAPTWLHSHRPIHTPGGSLPVLRVLIVLEDTQGTELAVVVSGGGGWSSRVGVVVSSSSWTGSTMDFGLTPEEGWVSPAQLVPFDTVQLDIPKANSVLGVPPITIDYEGISAARAYPVSESSTTPQSIVYEFPRMVVGVVSLASGSWSSSVSGGRIAIEFCEVLEDVATGKCVRQGGYTQNGTMDTYMLPKHSGVGGFNLTTRFSWRGFQYAIVTASSGASFRGSLNDLRAHWVGADIESTADISFEGDGAALFTDINAMVHLGMLSNLVTGIPTDCPTREKCGRLCACV